MMIVGVPVAPRISAVMRMPVSHVSRHVLVNRATDAKSFQKLLDPDLLKHPVV